MENIKIAVLGDTGTGKTQLIRALAGLPFDQKYTQTTNIEHNSISFTDPKDMKKVEMQLLDFPGTARYGDFVRKNLAGVSGAIIVCNVTNSGTIQSSVKWLNEFAKSCTGPCYLVINKMDYVKDYEEDNWEDYIDPIKSRFFKVFYVSTKDPKCIRKMGTMQSIFDIMPNLYAHINLTKHNPQIVVSDEDVGNDEFGNCKPQKEDPLAYWSNSYWSGAGGPKISQKEIMKELRYDNYGDQKTNDKKLRKTEWELFSESFVEVVEFSAVLCGDMAVSLYDKIKKDIDQNYEIQKLLFKMKPINELTAKDFQLINTKKVVFFIVEQIKALSDPDNLVITTEYTFDCAICKLKDVGPVIAELSKRDLACSFEEGEPYGKITITWGQ